MSLASGHKAVDMEGQELTKQKKDWKGYHNGLVRLTPGGWIFPTAYLKFADQIYNFKYQPMDVMVLTWPKCGTTWMQEIVWTMRNNPNLDHPMTLVPIMARSPFQDFDMIIDADLETFTDDNPVVKGFKQLCPGKKTEDGMMLQMCEALPHPRTIKSHLPFSLHSPSLLNTAKVVYVARNPKDVIVSYHHHSRLLHCHGYQGSFQEFVQYFVDDELMYGPYWLHIKEAWEKRHHPNLHIIFFEDLKADFMGELKKLDTFLDTNLSDQQLQNVVKHSSFEEMKAHNMNKEELIFMNTEVFKNDGGFFRKGEAGDWKGKLTPELEAKVDKWIAEKLNNLNINFKYSA